MPRYRVQGHGCRIDADAELGAKRETIPAPILGRSPLQVKATLLTGNHSDQLGLQHIFILFKTTLSRPGHASENRKCPDIEYRAMLSFARATPSSPDNVLVRVSAGH
jgi:hypothetical protein